MAEPQSPKPSIWRRMFGRGTRNDAPGGFQNIITGIGTAADKRSGGRFVLNIVTSQQGRDLWRGNDLVKRIIEDRPTEALREGFELKLDDEDLAKAVMTGLAGIQGPRHIGNGWKKAILQARFYECAGGGGAIWPWINDGSGDMSQPLNEESIGTLERFQVFESRELRPAQYYTDPMDPKRGEIATYYVVPVGSNIANGGEAEAGLSEIHETRLIIFPGVRITREEQSGCEPGWGDNIITPVNTVLNDFELTFGAAANLMQDFAQAVLKLDGLAEILAIDDGAAGNRLSETNKWRSVLRALVLDSKDSFERVTTNLTGFPEMLDRFMYRLAAASRMPVTRLMGMSPAGLNSTGESDQSNWYDTCAIEQEHLTPMIKRLVELYMLSQDSPTQGKIPEGWDLKFCPLWTPSDKEAAEIRKIDAETDAIYLDRQVVSPEEVAWRRGESLDIDFEDRAKLEPAAPPAVDPLPIKGGAPSGGGDPNAPAPPMPTDSTQTQPPDSNATYPGA